MEKLTAEKFNEVEELVLLEDTFINGKPVEKGKKVKVNGNDKMQLLASRRAERIAESKDSKK